MALQIIGIGSSANDGTGDTLRTAGNKINGNAGEIYARFGTGSANGATLEEATSANILVGNGTKFASVALSGDFEISNTGAMSVRSNEITIPSGSDPGSGNTTNKLYNVGGALFFNGNSVGTGNVTGMTQMRITGDSGGNKTVTNNEIVTIAGGTGITSVASDDQTITLNIDSTVATLTGTQTLENKTLTSPSVSGLTLSDASIVLEGSTANDFETTLTVTDPTADRTITFPDAAGTVALTSDITVTASSSTAFTNKTIDANGTGNSITNLEVADFAAASVVTQSEGIGSNNNDTTIPTSAAVKAYADSVGGGNSFTTIAVSGQNNVVADSGTDTLTLAAGSNVTITTNDSTDTVTIAASGGGASTLSGLSDTSISSSASGQTLMYDGSNSYDNKQIKVFEDNAAFTASFPLFFGAQMFTISAADTSYGYRFENYNSNGTNMDSGAGDAVGTLTVFEDQIMMFQLNQGGHAFAIRTGASGGNTGTNLTSSNGGNNLIHIATDGTVTSGTSANAKTSGTLIWKVPHFGSNQASTYYYQCTAHPASMYGLIKIRTITY